ncbi:CoA pyrophosphatase [Agarivorans gilvus]|uniref:Nudix hydrolase NudL n=1 Tax=Agarivorans gilvus TaxID=680279 RepID=A0ABQ1HY79_9ALTE|nr:CoA pyrophosphatase [Agarivorans gilvus]GGA94913.1 putative Nudix hydrolase NudL [Agarivorans gilvus]
MPRHQHYLQRFLLQRPKARPSATNHIPAAVLLPIVSLPGHSDKLVLTQRSDKLRHHPSQISFPGGKLDPQDPNLAATALRETYEEIGIAPQAFKLVGQLPQHQTVTNFVIHPFLATCNTPLHFKLNQHEVARVMQLPLEAFLDLNNYQTYHFRRHGQQQKAYFIEVDNNVVWGATAKILRDFAFQCC